MHAIDDAGIRYFTFSALQINFNNPEKRYAVLHTMVLSSGHGKLLVLTKTFSLL